LARRTGGTKIIKVLDFGISKMRSDTEQSGRAGVVTKATEVFGSPWYMSPEQLTACWDVDARSDVWSLGVLLFELLTAQMPFQCGTLAQTYGSILHEAPRRLTEVRKDMPAGVESAIL